MLNLIVRDLKDPMIRENFLRISNYFAENGKLLGFEFYELDIGIASTNYRKRHNLGFIPKDVIQTSIIGTGSLTWNYSLFDKEFFDLTTTGPCKVRFLIGAYE